MKTTVNNTAFIDAFTRAGRASKFSHQALELLFEYIEQLEDDTGEETELDVIAICCDYTESSLTEVLSNYSVTVGEDASDDEALEVVRNYLTDYTILVGETPTGFVYLQF